VEERLFAFTVPFNVAPEEVIRLAAVVITIGGQRGVMVISLP
jgi:hypothetical protein